MSCYRERIPLEKRLLRVGRKSYSHIPVIAAIKVGAYIAELNILLDDIRYNSQYYDEFIYDMLDDEILMAEALHQISKQKNGSGFVYYLIIEPFAMLYEKEKNYE